MTIVARVPKEAISKSGDTFVWAFFTNPQAPGGSWSDMPIRAKAQVDKAGNATVIAIRENFGWAGNDGVPGDGYRAIVFAGPDSARLFLRSSFRDKSKATTRVSVR